MTAGGTIRGCRCGTSQRPVLSAIVASNTQLFSTGRISTELTRPSIVALRAFSSAAMLVTPFAVLPGLAAAALAAVTLIGLADWQVLRRPPIRGYLEA